MNADKNQKPTSSRVVTDEELLEFVESTQRGLKLAAGLGLVALGLSRIGGLVILRHGLKLLNLSDDGSAQLAEVVTGVFGIIREEWPS
jgi:hypothetical protein